MEGNALATLGTAIEFVWTQFSTMATNIMSQPILLIGVAVFAAGAAIGLVKRLVG